MRLKCSIDNNGINDVITFHSNVFSLDISCKGTSYSNYAAPFIIIFGLQSGTSNSNSVNIKDATDDAFVGAGEISDDVLISSTGCDALYFYAFIDQDLTTAYSDVDISLSTADTIKPEDLVESITPQILTVNTEAPFIKQMFL